MACSDAAPLRPALCFVYGLLLLLALLGLAPPLPAQQETPDIHVVRETTQPASRRLYATVRGVERTPARARIAGRIQSLRAEEGDTVRRAQVLGRVVDPELNDRIRAARGEVDNAEAERERAADAVARLQPLLSQGYVSEDRFVEARQTLAAAEGALRAARSRLAQRLSRSRRGEILAPVAGRVLQVPLTVGTAVNRGETVLEIAADPPIIRLLAPERHAGLLSRRDTVTVEGAAGETPARIVRVYPEIVDGRVQVDLQLDEATASEFRGQRVAVRLETDRRQSIVVPLDYVAVRHGLAYVRPVRGGLRLVRTGRIGPAGVEILAGLSGGERLRRP